MNELSSQRNWFPVILVGLTFLLAFIFYAKLNAVDVTKWLRADRSSVVQPVVPVVTAEEYQNAVLSVVSRYRETSNAREAYDALILLHVPAAFQQFHIDCIVAFGKMIDGNVADATTRFDAMRAQYPWFTL